MLYGINLLSKLLIDLNLIFCFLKLNNDTNVVGVYRCAMIQFPTLKKELIF